MLLLKNAILNAPVLLLLFAVIPCLFLASLLLPSRAFIATMFFLCLHGRPPHWKGFANVCGGIVAGPWKGAKVIGSKVENVQTVIVATPAAWTPLHNCFCWKFVCWALIIKHSWASLSAPLCVVTELPSIYNAPVVRLLFNLAGWHDFRTDSIKRLLDRGHSLLLFDECLAALQVKKALNPVAFVRLEIEL